MKAFHGKQSIKDEYMNRLKDHRERDEIVKGHYWQGGKGCAVGCTIHGNNHKSYEEELGIPMVLAKLEDSIFEELPNEEAKEFPLNFLSVINVGADLSSVGDKFLHWLLVDKIHGVIQYVENKKIIRDIADLYKRKIDGEYIHIDEWEAVNAAADYIVIDDPTDSSFTARAARAASNAARAVDASNAVVAAVAAIATATVAVAIANAHAHAAVYKARTAQAAKLIELLKETKSKEV